MGDVIHNMINPVQQFSYSNTYLHNFIFFNSIGPFTLQKNFGTARKQIVRVPKNVKYASFTRLFFYRANHSENHVLVECWAQGFGQHTRTYRRAHVELFRENGGHSRPQSPRFVCSAVETRGLWVHCLPDVIKFMTPLAHV